MKNEFAFLYPPPASLRFSGADLDIRSLCFPLEMFKKFAMLFDHFAIKNRNRGLEVIFQDRGDLGAEEYALDCGPGRIVLSSSRPRGQFYAVSTLLQILAGHEAAGSIPCFSLRDAPQVSFRGFMLRGGEGAAPAIPGLRRLLLKLALLKFNHFALPVAALAPTADGAPARSDIKALVALAGVTGVEIIWIDDDERALFHYASGSPGSDRVCERPLLPAAGESAAGSRPDAWLDFFLARQRQGQARGKQTAVWSDAFLLHPEWIRKIPRTVLVLNRSEVSGRPEYYSNAVLPFKRHHVAQALCPVLCGRDRLIPDARAGMARVEAAFAAARTWKLAGVMLASDEREGGGCLPEAAAMIHFQAGCLLWSGRPPGPAAFSRWALGREEPDLFRVYSFLAQAEHRLPQAHGRYLFEDPLLAPFSSQDDAREIENHFHKAALYLEKREVGGDELAGFIDFCRHLYEFIAVKVRFSARLGALLREENGGEEVSRQAAWLDREAGRLQAAYLKLWWRHLPPEGFPESTGGFALLQERFHYLSRAASSAAAREKLLAELQN